MFGWFKRKARKPTPYSGAYRSGPQSTTYVPDTYIHTTTYHHHDSGSSSCGSSSYDGGGGSCDGGGGGGD